MAHPLVFNLFEFLWNQTYPLHAFVDVSSNDFEQHLSNSNTQYSPEMALKCFRKVKKRKKLFEVQDFLVYFDIGAMIETMFAQPIWNHPQNLKKPIQVLRQLRNETCHIRVVPDEAFYDEWFQKGHDACLLVVEAFPDKEQAAQRLAKDIEHAKSSFTRAELEQQVEMHIQKATRRDLLREINLLHSMNIVSPVISTSIEYARDICGEFVTKVNVLI